MCPSLQRRSLGGEGGKFREVFLKRPGRSGDEVGLLFLAAGVGLAFVTILSEPGACGGGFTGCAMGGG
jgi:hypothetical protein